MSTDLMWAALAVAVLVALVAALAARAEPPRLRGVWRGRIYATDPRAQLRARPHLRGTVDSAGRAARAYYRWKW